METPGTKTLNDSSANEVNTEVGGIVNSDSPKVMPTEVNQFNDLDDASSAAQDDKEKGKTDDGKKDEGKQDASGKAKDPTEGKDDEARFDKHPAWQRIKKERDDARLEKAKLEGMLEAVQTTAKPVRKEEPAPLPFKDINKMTPEQIREWQEDDPKGFAENLQKQAIHIAKQEVMQEHHMRTQAEQERGGLQKSYEEFEKVHTDFRKMWDSGEIMDYIKTHPGENPKSAYFQLTLNDKISEAVAKAKKETEEEVTKRFQAKRSAKVLGEGPSGAGRAVEDPTLQNTKQHGGRTAVLADKLRSMRQATH